DVAPCTEALQRFEPCIEEWARRFLVLQEPAVNRPRAVVDVEVHIELVASPGVDIAGQMLLDPRPRSQQPLLFPAPQRDANGPAWPRTDGFEYPHRLHYRSRAVSVVGGPYTRVPGVEVPPNHD